MTATRLTPVATLAREGTGDFGDHRNLDPEDFRPTGPNGTPEAVPYVVGIRTKVSPTTLAWQRNAGLAPSLADQLAAQRAALTADVTARIAALTPGDETGAADIWAAVVCGVGGGVLQPADWKAAHAHLNQRMAEALPAQTAAAA